MRGIYIMETFLWVEEYRPKDVKSCILPKNVKKNTHRFLMSLVSTSNIPSAVEERKDQGPLSYCFAV